MVGGNTIHRWIHTASLGRDEKGFRFKREEKEPFETRELYVSLDRADNVIEGGTAFETAFELPGGPFVTLRDRWGF